MKILIIRRDNIGDLICTTPLIRNLRIAYPHAQLDILVNSYNKAAIEHNPDLNNIYCYTKGKHRAAEQRLWSVHIERIKTLWILRQNRYDYIILAQASFSIYPFRLAKWIKPQAIIGYAPENTVSPIQLTHPIPTSVFTQQTHEVERVLKLLKPLSVKYESLTPLVLKASPRLTEALKQELKLRKNIPIIGIHISARKIDQRWPTEYFIELIRELDQKSFYQFMLFWSPGNENNKHHPGDDLKAQQIMAGLPNAPLLPCPTERLEELIAAMSLCDAVICSDGGAMHVAAGLGKPIVCFFGSSNAKQWHPWGVPHVVLQPTTHKVLNILPIQVIEAMKIL